MLLEENSTGLLCVCLRLAANEPSHALVVLTMTEAAWEITCGITALRRLQSEALGVRRVKTSAGLLLCWPLGRREQAPPLGSGPCRWSAWIWWRTAVWRERAERRTRTLSVNFPSCQFANKKLSRKHTWWLTLKVWYVTIDLLLDSYSWKHAPQQKLQTLKYKK